MTNEGRDEGGVEKEGKKDKRAWTRKLFSTFLNDVKLINDLKVKTKMNEGDG